MRDGSRGMLAHHRRADDVAGHADDGQDLPGCGLEQRFPAHEALVAGVEPGERRVRGRRVIAVVQRGHHGPRPEAGA